MVVRKTEALTIEGQGYMYYTHLCILDKPVT